MQCSLEYNAGSGLRKLATESSFSAAIASRHPSGALNGLSLSCRAGIASSKTSRQGSVTRLDSSNNMMHTPCLAPSYRAVPMDYTLCGYETARQRASNSLIAERMLAQG